LADAIILPGAIATASAVHHVGMSVASIDDALAFWAAFVDLPGGVILELLDYQTAGKCANPEATANPGNIHLCLAVEDAGAAWRHAVDCGAKPVRREGPVEIDHGPNVGAQVAYLRIHDGITLELFQRPPSV
jgi:catechol 2,3-dioxygenase-like lactoylglutathione lyase family enzyme